MAKRGRLGASIIAIVAIAAGGSCSPAAGECETREERDCWCPSGCVMTRLSCDASATVGKQTCANGTFGACNCHVEPDPACESACAEGAAASCDRLRCVQTCSAQISLLVSSVPPEGDPAACRDAYLAARRCAPSCGETGVDLGTDACVVAEWNVRATCELGSTELVAGCSTLPQCSGCSTCADVCQCVTSDLAITGDPCPEVCDR